MSVPGGFGKSTKKRVAVLEQEIALPSSENVQNSPDFMSQDQIESAWKSIQDMLVQNRCWLCENVFARGKTKKVFMVSHLLRYLEERFTSEKQRAEISQTAIDASVEKGSNENVSQSAVLVSRHLRNCWAAFSALDGDKNKIAISLQKVDCEVWMSGLICARTKDCALEYLLLVPDGKVSTAVINETNEDLFDPDGYSKSRQGNVFRDKNGNICPPGCDCDNPWQYVQAALLQSSTASLTIPGDMEDSEEKLDSAST